MKKLSITMTMTLEYEPDLERYPEGSTPEEMLEIDMGLVEDDPFTFMNSKWKITGRVLKS